MTLSSLVAATLALAAPLHAAEYPRPVESDWTAKDFRFHTGAMLSELRLHYATIGAPTGEPVLVLHGTAQSAAAMLAPAFAGALFGPGQPLDAQRYFLIVPDAIGTGHSAKPSDGLRARFPLYDYDDLVLAQYRLLTEGLGLRHLRLIIGNSMGGMETWIWGGTHPDFADALVPMASQPTPMAARNWMLRRMLIETITRDPAYDGGDYQVQPPSLRTASILFGLATNGGTLALQAQAGTHAAADGVVDRLLAAPPPADANDFLWQWAASADYDPSGNLAKITAPVLAINSADDERNPPETGVTVQALARIRNARLLLIPASPQTHGHGTTGSAAFYAPQLADFLATTPHRTD